MDARSLAVALNGDVAGPDRVLAPGPGHNPRDRSLSIRLDPGAPEGFVCHSFSSDDWRECRDHIRHTVGLARPEQVARSAKARKHRTATTTADALALWQRSTDAHDTLVETYLHSRHLELPIGDAVIRHAPKIGLHGEPEAIMVGLMRDVATDEPVAVHRTYIDHNGNKTERKILGPSRGAAVKLAPAGAALVLAEGTETGLAAVAAGMNPVWAMGSAGAIGSLPLLPSVERLVILAENDGGASRDAVSACGHRWEGASGKQLFVVTPTVSKDFADVWACASTEWREHVKIERLPS
jgi:putative DNA primase/helicase